MTPTTALAERTLVDLLAPLLQHLQLSARGSFWVVTVPTVASQARVADFIRRRVQDSHSLADLRYSADRLGFAEKIHGLAPPQREQALAFVHDLDKLGTAQRGTAVGYMNRGREALTDSAYTVVLFVLAPTLKDIIHFAGDLWAWRSGMSDLGDWAVPLDETQDRQALEQRYRESLIAQHRHMRGPLRPSRLVGFSEPVELEQLFVLFDRLMPFAPEHSGHG